MVKFYESHLSYDYPFPTVTLAYFLRYPNPYSRHVLSTDVIESYVDPQTSRLHTVRLHLKRSKIPSSILRLLPQGVLSAARGNGGQSYILERSVVDVKEGWMKTESKNLEWTAVLSVIENQLYTRSKKADESALDSDSLVTSTSPAADPEEWTDVRTTVTFRSRLGQGKFLKSRTLRSGRSSPPAEMTDEEEEAPVRKGLFSSWSTSSIQRSIELIGARRTRDHLSKSTEGMKTVLERLRGGGLVAVLEGMKRDRDALSGGDGPWKRVWHHGTDHREDAGVAHVDDQDD